MAKSVTSKTYKLPGSKGREARIKVCPCTKVNGQPIIQRPFVATEFKGFCCEQCFEIINFELNIDVEPKQINEDGVVI